MQPSPPDPKHARASLLSLLDRLHRALLAQFAELAGVSARRRGAVRRRVLLGLELMCKLEEQVLFPALAASEPEAMSVPIGLAGQEIELLRDLAQLAAMRSKGQREARMAVLEGLATVHFGRADELMHSASGANLAWAELDGEVRGLLERWRAEVGLTGGIEDEDRDPVGLPPR